ncbi:uncharacterized protein [Prorops nasuta]|uniref:uncharacterized protein n=1 Tax=Prorops nasuta TaxID=863751 RepID=UPI0034CF87ED
MMTKKNLLVYYPDGFIYHNSRSYNKKNGEIITYLKCKDPGCPGTAKIKNGKDFSIGAIHCHECPTHYKEIADFREDLYKTITTMPCTPKEAYTFNAKRHSVAAQEISFASVQKSLKKWRSVGFPLPPKSLRDCAITLNTDKWIKFLTFTLGDDEYKLNILQYEEGNFIAVIFYEKRLNEVLQECNVISLDGTFRTVPTIENATQLITIMGKIGEKFFPFIWILLNTKNQRFYTNAFNFLKSNLIPKFNPKIGISDFEKSIHNSLVAAFPGIKVQGCYFHYVQSVRKHIQQLKIFTAIKSLEPDTASRALLIIRKFYNLPFLPPNYIKTGFLIIKEEIRKFQWILRTNENILSIFKAIDRTNNPQERYHRTINSLIGNHPTFPTFCVKLIELIEETVRERKQLEKGLKIRNLNKKVEDEDFNQFIKDAWDKLESELKGNERKAIKRFLTLSSIKKAGTIKQIKNEIKDKNTMLFVKL